MTITPILQKMAVMVVLMLIGFLGTRLGITGPGFNKYANPVVINVFLLATILNAVIGTTDRVSGTVLARYFGVMVLMFVICMLIAEATVRLLPVPKETRGVLWCLTAFMNNAFIGFPLAGAIYGEQGVFYAAISNIPFSVFLYTIGMIKLRGSDGSKRDLKMIFSPPLITTLLAAAIYLLNVPIPTIVKDVVGTTAGATIPVSMVIIGTSLGSISVKEVFSSPKVYVASAVRLIVVPVIVWAILRLFVFDPMMLGIAVLIAACPCGMVITVFCLQYGKDDLFSSQVIFMSTLLSALTIPALFAVLF